MEAHDNQRLSIVESKVDRLQQEVSAQRVEIRMLTESVREGRAELAELRELAADWKATRRMSKWILGILSLLVGVLGLIGGFFFHKAAS